MMPRNKQNKRNTGDSAASSSVASSSNVSANAIGFKKKSSCAVRTGVPTTLKNNPVYSFIESQVVDSEKNRYANAARRYYLVDMKDLCGHNDPLVPGYTIVDRHISIDEKYDPKNEKQDYSVCHYTEEYENGYKARVYFSIDNNYLFKELNCTFKKKSSDNAWEYLDDAFDECVKKSIVEKVQDVLRPVVAGRQKNMVEQLGTEIDDKINKIYALIIDSDEVRRRQQAFFDQVYSEINSGKKTLESCVDGLLDEVITMSEEYNRFSLKKEEFLSVVCPAVERFKKRLQEENQIEEGGYAPLPDQSIIVYGSGEKEKEEILSKEKGKQTRKGKEKNTHVSVDRTSDEDFDAVLAAFGGPRSKTPNSANTVAETPRGEDIPEDDVKTKVLSAVPPVVPLKKGREKAKELRRLRNEREQREALEKQKEALEKQKATQELAIELLSAIFGASRSNANVPIFRF